MQVIVVTICLIVFLAAGSTSIASQAEAMTAQAAEHKAAQLEKRQSASAVATAPSSPKSLTHYEVQVIDPKGSQPLDDAVTCLARTIYWESRGEGYAGMQAVANVVMNRLKHPGFPDTICEIVKQGSEQGSCEFSWWCDGQPDEVIELVLEEKAYGLAREFARRALNRELHDRTEGALYYHNSQISPYWSKEYIRKVQVGQHVFYKPAAGKAR
jgi:spore germination cell wall hydrolase CwlJ-like protein